MNREPVLGINPVSSTLRPSSPPITSEANELGANSVSNHGFKIYSRIEPCQRIPNKASHIASQATEERKEEY